MAHAPRIQAVAFDAFGTLFDVYSVGLLAEQLYPGKGTALAELWRIKQIEYSFIRTLSGRYKSFWDITQDGLQYAAAKLGLELDAQRRTQLMNQYACLSPFPENLGALRTLKEAGVPTAILSNGTPGMLEAAAKAAGIAPLVDEILSVEEVGTFKPDPRVYRLATRQFGCPPDRLMFVSANAWDAQAAHACNMDVVRVDRAGAPDEYGLAATGVPVLRDLSGLPDLLA